MKATRIILCLLVAVLYLAQSGMAEERSGENGNPVASQKRQGLNGWLLLTSDRDWKQKWDTPQEHVPTFTESKNVEPGESITILTFYTNPAVDEHGVLDITCDIKVVMPDKRISYEEKNIICAEGELAGDPGNTRLAYAVIDYTGEPEDPFGLWTVEVTLRDNNGGDVVSLQEQFELVEQEGLIRI